MEPEVEVAQQHVPTTLLENLARNFPNLPDLVELVGRAIVDEPPLALKEGGLIRDGFDANLDEFASRHHATAKTGSPNFSRTKSSRPESRR